MHMPYTPTHTPHTHTYTYTYTTHMSYACTHMHVHSYTHAHTTTHPYTHDHSLIHSYTQPPLTHTLMHIVTTHSRMRTLTHTPWVTCIWNSLHFFDVIVNEHNLHNHVREYICIYMGCVHVYGMCIWMWTCLKGGNICFRSTDNGFTTIGLVVPAKRFRLLHPGKTSLWNGQVTRRRGSVE